MTFYKAKLKGNIFISGGDINTFKKDYAKNIADHILTSSVGGPLNKMKIETRFYDDMSFITKVALDTQSANDIGIENQEEFENWLEDITDDFAYDAILATVYENLTMPVDVAEISIVIWN